MNTSSAKLFAFVIIVSVGLWIFAFVRHHNREPELAHAELKTAIPTLADRINLDITKLESESITESLAKLSYVNMFYWPGPPTSSGGVVKEWIPLDKDADQESIEAIMSNRRFRKVLEALGAMNKTTAAKMMNSELSSAIAEYLPLYDAEMQRMAPSFKADKANQLIPGKPTVIVGPSFEIDNVPEGEVVIVGARLKVIALVWASGMLGLTDSKEQVERVARLAVKQRTDLYDNPTLNPLFKAEMLHMASLYNRQIISSGLLGVEANHNLETSAMKIAGVEWQDRKLTSYKAALTEYDIPVESGRMNPDYSQGSLTVRFASPMSDTNFDTLLKEIHFVL